MTEKLKNGIHFSKEKREKRKLWNQAAAWNSKKETE